ncbi:MAG: hypothetical protein ACOCZG_02745 [Halothece sp.]
MKVGWGESGMGGFSRSHSPTLSLIPYLPLSPSSQLKVISPRMKQPWELKGGIEGGYN